MGSKEISVSWFIPWGSKCILRRYLDPPNPLQTLSQKVLGALRIVILIDLEPTSGALTHVFVFFPSEVTTPLFDVFL